LVTNAALALNAANLVSDVLSKVYAGSLPHSVNEGEKPGRQS